MQRCANAQHVRLTPSSRVETDSSQLDEWMCITCLADHCEAWSPHILFTQLCRLIALVCSMRSAAPYPRVSIPPLQAEALVKLTTRLFQRVCTPDSLKLENEAEDEERRLRTTFIHWLRVLYTATVARAVETCCAESESCRLQRGSEPWLLGMDEGAWDGHTEQSRTLPDDPAPAHALAARLTESLVHEVHSSIARAPSSPTAGMKAAACVLLMTDLCADAEALGPHILPHVCADHIGQVVPLLTIVMRVASGDGLLLELFLYWLHQMVVWCQSSPESLEQLAATITEACSPSQCSEPTRMAAYTTATRPNVMQSLVDCVVDYCDRVPVVLNALSLLSVLLTKTTTVQCFASWRGTSLSDCAVLGSCGATRTSEGSWADAVLRASVPLLLHRSETVAALAAEVMQRVLVQATRFGGVEWSLLDWVEDCALEAIGEATCTSAEGLLALLSTWQATVSTHTSYGDVRGREKCGRVLQAFYRFADLPTEVWIAAHACPYFAWRLCQGTDTDTEAFATRCLRERAKAVQLRQPSMHCLPAALGCFLQEMQWLCARRDLLSALPPEIVSALTHALLVVFAPNAATRLDDLVPSDFARPLLEMPTRYSSTALAARVVEIVAQLAQAGATLPPVPLIALGVWALQQLLAGEDVVLPDPLSPPVLSGREWRAAVHLTQLLLNMAAPLHECGPASHTGDDSTNSTLPIVSMTRALLQRGLLDVLLTSAPGPGRSTGAMTPQGTCMLSQEDEEQTNTDAAQLREDLAEWPRTLVSALLCGMPLSVDVALAWLPVGGAMRTWPELLVCAECDDTPYHYSADAVLLSLAAWDCLGHAVGEAQLLQRLRRHVRYIHSHQPRHRPRTPPPNLTDDTVCVTDAHEEAGGDDTVALVTDVDDWVMAVACAVMLLWTYLRVFDRLPPATVVTMPDEHQPFAHLAALPIKVASALLNVHTRTAICPVMRWCASRMALSDRSLHARAFAQKLMDDSAWQPLGCALCLLSYLEDDTRVDEDGGPWWRLTPSCPTSSLNKAPAVPRDAIVALALTHVQHRYRSHRRQSSGSLRTTRQLLELVRRILVDARSCTQPTEARVPTVAQNTHNHIHALHRCVLEKHLRPLLLVSPPTAARARTTVSTVAEEQDALAAVFIETLAGLGQADVATVSALALRRFFPTLQARLQDITDGDATACADVYHSATVWLQLTYMLAQGYAGDRGSDDNSLQARAVALTTLLAQAGEVVHTHLRNARSDDACLCAGRVLALCTLLNGSLRRVLQCHATVPEPPWWAVLPLSDMEGAFAGGYAVPGTATGLPPWRSMLLFLHVLSRAFSADKATSTSPVSTAELTAVGVTLDWALTVFCATTVEEKDACTRPCLNPVARLVGDLLHRYRRQLAGSLQVFALFTLCRAPRSALTAVEQGWLLCGLVRAMPGLCWMRPLPRAEQEKTVCELLEHYNHTVADWSRRRSLHSAEEEEAWAVARTLVRACERFFADTPTTTRLPSLCRIEDFVGPLCTEGARGRDQSSRDVTMERLYFYDVSGGVDVLLAAREFPIPPRRLA